MASLKEKIKSVFMKSYVLSFAEIAETSSRTRRFFTLVIFMSCLFGFVYQLYQFSMLYLSYATEQKELSTIPNYVELPAISFCNVNAFRYSKLCKLEDSYDFSSNNRCRKYPTLCERSMKKSKQMCQSRQLVEKLDTKEVWKIAENFSHTESMFHSCVEIIGNERKPCDFFKSEKRVFPPLRHGITSQKPSLCYTFNSAIGKPASRGKILHKSTRIEMVLLTEIEEYELTLLRPGLFIALHDRKKLVNPFFSGDILYGGERYQYNIVKEVQRSLLPAPYDTNCTDYLSPWKQNNGSGPLDFQDCLYKCVLSELKAVNSCVPIDFPMPHEELICKYVSHLWQTFEENCYNLCGRKPCFEKSYEVELLKKGFITHLEIASRIGGYLGLWTGLSFLQMADLVVSIYLILFYTVSHLKKERSSAIRPIELKQNRKKTVQRKKETSSESIFKKSFISSIADGITSKSKKEKFIKLVIFLLNLFGFLYFTYDFAVEYLAYETTSIQMIDRPLLIDRPAITFCDTNRRNRKIVCKEQPHKCVFYKSEEEFCTKYQKYCNLDDLYYGVFTADPECEDDCYGWQRAIREFKYLILTQYDNNYRGYFDWKMYNQVPFTDNEGEPAICMSYGLKYWSLKYYTNTNRTAFERIPEKTIWENLTSVHTWKDFLFYIQINPDEYLDPNAQPAVYFVIHDFRKLVNPFRHGIKFSAPGMHFLQVTDYIEQHLLPHPYDTNCTSLSLEENEDENADLVDCIDNCNFNLHMKQYGCVPRSISISHLAKLCKKDEKVTNQNKDICLKKCSRNPCVSRTYKYRHLKNTMQKMNVDYKEMKLLYPKHYNNSRILYVGVSFRNLKGQIIKFVPKMVPIDLFSNIGGFLGIWIGSSIISLFDLLYKLSEYVYIRITKLLRKRKKQNLISRNP